jgi:PA14 domain
MMMKPTKRRLFSRATLVLVLLLLLGGADAWAAVRGRALLIDSPHRCKPGNLILCVINGEKRKFETLAEGKVIDARFSPDGKGVVYGVDGKIRIMNLKTRKSRDLCPYEAGKENFTYFNWGTGDKIYWSGGKDHRQIFCFDIKTRQKTEVHKGNKGRSTVSLDGKRAAWVMPPVAAFVGGKQFRYQGGCGGAVSPSGKYLTSNLTTTHMLMGILTFGPEGPSKNPLTVVSSPGPGKNAFNGFSFGRTDDWVCYTIEHPKNVSPTSYICYWRTGDHIRVSEFGKYCIKDFFDETDVLPAGAKLEKITVCREGPTNTPLEHVFSNVGLTRRLKVVGHYTAGGQQYTPQLRKGITWKLDKSKLAMTASTCKGLAKATKVTVTAEYKGKRDSFDITLLPKLTGDGFKAEYFKGADFKELVLTRVDPRIYFRWGGRASPDKSVNGRKPWSARWTGMVNVQTEGEYTFYFLQGEGNDKFLKGKDGKKTTGWRVLVNGKLELTITKGWNYPWVKPRKSAPLKLKKGMHAIKVETVDVSAHPVVAELYWSGPGIKQSLLGKPYIHSNGGAAKKR